MSHGTIGTAPVVRRRVEEIQDEVALLAAHVAAATARMLELLAELQGREAWASGGFQSLAHWLSWRTGLEPVTAREHVRVACSLAALPRIGAAFRAGELSYSKVRALTRIARPETDEALAEIGRAASAAQLERIVRGYRRAEPEAEDARALERREGRRLDVFHDDDGMLVVRGRLDPEAGARLLRAIDTARDELFRDRPRDVEITSAQARADALAWVAERSLATGEPAERRASDRTMVVVHVDREVLAEPAVDGRSELEDGPAVSAESARRLACDCSVVEMTRGPDGELHAGRRTRVLSVAQERALRERDRGHCSFPGCGNRIVDAHHAAHWANGGETVLSNLALACTWHHVLLHEGGWSVRIEADGVSWLRPDGRAQPEAPPLPPVVGPPIVALSRLAPAAVSAYTLAPTGGPCDCAWTAETLVWRTRRRPPAPAASAAPPPVEDEDDDDPAYHMTPGGISVDLWADDPPASGF